LVQNVENEPHIGLGVGLKVESDRGDSRF